MSVDFSSSHKAMDAEGHERTYSGFVKGVIFCSGFCVMVLVMMAIVLL